MSLYHVTRRIGIDAGHRIRNHGSKCRHIHGHRYEIEATCAAPRPHDDGEQSGMVLDFGFLKDEMLDVIDAPCDHGFLAEIADADALAMLCPPTADFAGWQAALSAEVAARGFALTTETRLATKLYIIAGPPTAEGLAAHWFSRLAPRVSSRSDGLARLVNLRVWETPNCHADYSA